MKALFDGSATPGVVVLEDYSGVQVRLTAETDDDARLAYGLIVEVLETLQHVELREARAKERLAEALAVWGRE